jgi:hypothetical protein
MVAAIAGECVQFSIVTERHLDGFQITAPDFTRCTASGESKLAALGDIRKRIYERCTILAATKKPLQILRPVGEWLRSGLHEGGEWTVVTVTVEHLFPKPV